MTYKYIITKTSVVFVHGKDRSMAEPKCIWKPDILQSWHFRSLGRGETVQEMVQGQLLKEEVGFMATAHKILFQMYNIKGSNVKSCFKHFKKYMKNFVVYEKVS